MEDAKLDEILKKLVSKLSVLVVEDSAFDRELLDATLKKIGFRKIQFAENGSIATSKISNALAITKPFDLIFLDWKMPGKDGRSLLKWIRSQGKLHKVPVFLITASLAEQDVEEFQEDGADYFIVKPVSHEVLAKKIHHLFLTRGKNAA